MNDVALQTPNAQLRYMKLLSWIIVNPIGNRSIRPHVNSPTTNSPTQKMTRLRDIS